MVRFRIYLERDDGALRHGELMTGKSVIYLLFICYIKMKKALLRNQIISLLNGLGWLFGLRSILSFQSSISFIAFTIYSYYYQLCHFSDYLDFLFDFAWEYMLVYCQCLSDWVIEELIYCLACLVQLACQAEDNVIQALACLSCFYFREAVVFV